MNKQIYFLTTLTPVHAGGNEQLDIIDLPIQREKHTQFPKFEASTLKGALKSAYNGEKKDELFGKESSTQDNASSLGFSDARLLFFPVKSVNGVFAWVTCPAVISRFLRDTSDSTLSEEINFSNILHKALICMNSSVSFKDSKVILEEYSISVTPNEELTKFAEKIADIVYPSDNYWNKKLKTDLVVVDDNEFRDFVVNSTEIVTRIKIDQESKTVQENALFNVEYLPEDSILYFVQIANPPPNYKLDEEKANEIFAKNKPSVFQLGGDETLGKGMMGLHMMDGSEENSEQ